MSFEAFWHERFAARYAEEQAHEASLRDDAFAPTTLTVAGFELRPMTGSDLLLLHGYANPFIAGGRLLPEHIAQFIAIMVEPAPAGWWARRRFLRRIAGLPYRETCAGLKAYVRRMLACSGAISESAAAAPEAAEPEAPIEAHDLNFLVPLIVQIACETGWPEADILAMRLDRLFQYRRELESRAGIRGKLPRVERLRSECLAAYTAYLQEQSSALRPPPSVL